MSVIETPPRGNSIKLMDHAPDGVSSRCVSCGQPDVGRIIVFGAAKIALCEKHCLAAAAAEAGYTTAEESARVREQAKEDAQTIARLTGELEAAQVDAALVADAKKLQAHARSLIGALGQIVET